MHAHYRGRLHRVSAIDKVEMDHRVALMCLAFAARLNTRLATDAAVGIDEELVLLRNWQ